MAIKVTEFFSEYIVKDKATRVLKRVKKEEEQVNKSIDKQTKANKKRNRESKKSLDNLKKHTQETRKAEKETSKFARALKKLGPVRRVAGGVAGGALATAGGGGNLLGNVGKAIPFAGAVIVAAAGSIQKASSAFSEAARALGTRAQFRRGVALDPQLQQFATQLQAAGFARKDTEEALATLAQRGIKVNERLFGVIQTLSKVEGSVGNAVQRFLSGSLAQFGQRGLELEEIRKGVPTQGLAANAGTRLLVAQFERIFREQPALVKEQIKVTASFRKATARNAILERSREQNAIKLARTPGILTTVKKFEEATTSLSQSMAKTSVAVIDGTNALIKATKEIAQRFGLLPKPPKKQHGGSVSAGKTTLVGERGPELFVPQGGGQIIPNGKMGGVNIVNNFTINANNNNDIEEFVRSRLTATIDSLANTVWSRQLGLNTGVG